MSDLTHPPALQQVADDVTLDWLGTYSPETIDRFVHESYAALARRGPGSPYLVVFTERFVRERLRALAQAQGSVPKEIPEVLFVCVSNAGRSVMAAALLGRSAAGRVHVRIPRGVNRWITSMRTWFAASPRLESISARTSPSR